MTRTATIGSVSSIPGLRVDPRVRPLDGTIYRLLRRARNFVNEILLLQTRNAAGYVGMRLAFVDVEPGLEPFAGKYRIHNGNRVPVVNWVVWMRHVVNSFIKKEILS